jgi:2-polyprenyl-6-methoxyphenol hydroxylase-like FAD-dependent oxidoreductase
VGRPTPSQKKKIQATPHTSPLNVPVLISDVGPTGLFAAILLTKLGHPCRIIEHHLDILPLSNALVIHARTMEMFAMTGILDSFTSQGAHLSDIHAYLGGKLTSVLPALRGAESEYSYVLFLEQLRTTAILAEELEKIGGHVDRGWELLDTKVVTDPETGKEHVETVIRRALVGNNIRTTESTILGVVEEDRDEEGKEYEVQMVRSQCLIATDGGKSVVRHKLNIGFPGKTLDNNIILVDCLVDSPIPLKNITMCAYPAYLYLVL